MSAPQRRSGRLVTRRLSPVTRDPAFPLPQFGPVRVEPPPAGSGVPSGPHPVELAALLHELSMRLLTADGLGQALERFVAFTAGAVPGALRCSVVLIGDGEPLSRAAAGDGAEALDDLQFTLGHGPGLTAARTRAVISVPDLPADQRWPDLADCARADGVRAAAAVPLDVPRSSVGALSVYLPAPDCVGPELLITTMALVNQAEVLLGELRRREELGEDATVDRAVGVIIAQRGCGVHEAYDVLQETSQRLGLDRRAVADRLITAAARRGLSD